MVKVLPVGSDYKYSTLFIMIFLNLRFLQSSCIMLTSIQNNKAANIVVQNKNSTPGLSAVLLQCSQFPDLPSQGDLVNGERTKGGVRRNQLTEVRQDGSGQNRQGKAEHA